jgi:hypothetical protein
MFELFSIFWVLRRRSRRNPQKIEKASSESGNKLLKNDKKTVSQNRKIPSKNPEVFASGFWLYQ